MFAVILMGTLGPLGSQAIDRMAHAELQRLGSASFFERHEAERKLTELGVSAIPTLEEGQRSADAGTRERCSAMLDHAHAAAFDVRIDRLLRDTANLRRHDLPGWERFVKYAGNDAASKNFYAKVLRKDLVRAAKAARDPQPMISEAIAYCGQFREVTMWWRVEGPTQPPATFDILELVFWQLVFTDEKALEQLYQKEVEAKIERRSLSLAHETAEHGYYTWSHGEKGDIQYITAAALAWLSVLAEGDFRLGYDSGDSLSIALVSWQKHLGCLAIAEKVLTSERTNRDYKLYAMGSIVRVGDLNAAPILESRIDEGPMGQLYLIHAMELHGLRPQNFGFRAYPNCIGPLAVQWGIDCIELRLAVEMYSDYIRR